MVTPPPAASPDLPPGRRSLSHRWLLVLPFAWQVGLVPAVNDVSAASLHIPFPMFWQLLGIVVTSTVVGIVFRLDRRAGVEREEADFLAATEPTAQPAGARLDQGPER
jgi:Protein of unknown function (DUF3311)